MLRVRSLNSPGRAGISSRFVFRAAISMLLVACTAGSALASRADLARALALYNQRRFDQA